MADQQKIDMYIMTHEKYFPAEKIAYLRERLTNVEDSKFSIITSAEMKDPTTLLIISVLLGVWGVDRFMVGDMGMGILKLLTGGCCGILAIMDWFTISGKAKELNYQKIVNLI